MCCGATILCIKNKKQRRNLRFRAKSGSDHAGISMDNCACDTGFQFFRLLSNSHIYSIHQQETEIHLETHACQSLHYYYGNSGFSHSGLQLRHSFDSTYSNPNEKSNRSHIQISAYLVRIPGERLAMRTWHLKEGNSIMVSAQVPDWA